VKQPLFSVGHPLPGVAPCYIEPTITERGLTFLVKRTTLASSFGLLGGFLLVVSLLMIPLSLWLLFSLTTNKPQAGLGDALLMLAGGAAMGGCAVWLFQMIASADLLAIEGATASHSKKRWWRWRDKPIEVSDLRLVALTGRIGRDTSLSVVSISLDDQVLFLIAADKLKNAEKIGVFAQRMSERTGLVLEFSSSRIRVAGDVRLTK